MYKTNAEAEAMVKELRTLVDSTDQVEVVVCPPFTALSTVAAALKGTRIAVGGQDVYWEDQGAFTGEVSVHMLWGSGCRYCIIGHSERRQFFHDTDETINRKLKKLLTSEVVPILCVGEMLADREAGKVEEVVLGQMDRCLAGLTGEQISRIIVAYEPVWAIGTGKTATPQIAEDVHAMIRKWLAERASPQVAEGVRILYGGSVKPDNASDLMAQPDIDGALVGGASLDAKSFAKIVKF